jgi:hypothetical protein
LRGVARQCQRNRWQGATKYAGATIGRGSLDVSCAGCPARPALDDALSLSAFAGYRLTDRVGVFGEYWLTSYGTSVKYTT